MWALLIVTILSQGFTFKFFVNTLVQSILFCQFRFLLYSLAQTFNCHKVEQQSFHFFVISLSVPSLSNISILRASHTIRRNFKKSVQIKFLWRERGELGFFTLSVNNDVHQNRMSLIIYSQFYLYLFYKNLVLCEFVDVASEPL